MKAQHVISCMHCQTHGCFFKQYGSSINHRLVESKKHQSDYLQGQYIIHEGHPILGIYFVQQGNVKIFSSGLNGISQIVRLVNAGESLCFRGWDRATYLTSSVALDNSRICFFESKDFMEVCKSPQLSMYIIKHLGDELEVAEKRLRYLMQMNVREKIAEALLFMKKSFGINKEKELGVYMSREDIAAIAGTSQELVIRQLSEFEKDKIIERRDRGSKIALLNESKLNQLLSKYNIFS